jgi:hypothetical protein
VNGPACPPKAKAAVCVPVPPKVFLPVFKAPPVAHAPAAIVTSKFHSSVVTEPPTPGFEPPARTPEGPEPVAAPLYLADDILATSVQVAPSHCSVSP